MTHRLPSTSYILRLPTPLHQICVRFMTGALSTLQLPLNTNCLASCPFLKENWLAAGCYQLSACRTARQGGLHILEVAGSSEEGLDVTEVCSTRLPGIFDMKWNYWSNGSAQLGLALSNGSIGLFTPIPEERCLGPLHSLMIEAESIATCLDFNARIEGALATSTASGQLGLAQVTGNTLVVTQKFRAHESEIWSCKFSPWEAHLLISGADDCALKTWDIRSPCRSACSVNRDGHKAGICCIQASPLQETIIYTGCYDDKIRSWDLRNLRDPLEQVELGGGVWRIRWHPAQQDNLVAACMQKGCAVVKADVLSGCGMLVKHTYEAHDSLSYDAEWVCLGEKYIIASCSFYDGMLHFWQATDMDC